MTPSAVEYAVMRFRDLKAEVGETLEQITGSRLQCVVHQGTSGEDGTVWAFYSLELDIASGALLGRMVVPRASIDGVDRDVVVVLDTDSVRAIEFEVFDRELPDVEESPAPVIDLGGGDEDSILFCPVCREPGRNRGMVMMCANEDCVEFNKFYAELADE